MSMLHRFLAGQRRATGEIRAALQAGDLSTAERIAHTTRGVAGNIGAVSVVALAADVERAIRERQPRGRTNAMIDQLETTLGELVTSLDHALPLRDERTQIAVDAESLRTVCARLEALLVEGDAEAADVLSDNADLLHAAFPREYRSLESAIASFDFDRAVAVLRQASEVLQ